MPIFIIYEQASRLFDTLPYAPYHAKLSLSVIKKDKETCLSALKATLTAMREKWQPERSPLYRHLDSSEINILSKHLLSIVQEEMENGSEFAFLNDSPEYQELVKELKR